MINIKYLVILGWRFLTSFGMTDSFEFMGVKSGDSLNIQ